MDLVFNLTIWQRCPHHTCPRFRNMPPTWYYMLKKFSMDHECFICEIEAGRGQKKQDAYFNSEVIFDPSGSLEALVTSAGDSKGALIVILCLVSLATGCRGYIGPLHLRDRK